MDTVAVLEGKLALVLWLGIKIWRSAVATQIKSRDRKYSSLIIMQMFRSKLSQNIASYCVYVCCAFVCLCKCVCPYLYIAIYIGTYVCIYV